MTNQQIPPCKTCICLPMCKGKYNNNLRYDVAIIFTASKCSILRDYIEDNKMLNYTRISMANRCLKIHV